MEFNWDSNEYALLLQPKNPLYFIKLDIPQIKKQQQQQFYQGAKTCSLKKKKVSLESPKLLLQRFLCGWGGLFLSFPVEGFATLRAP